VSQTARTNCKIIISIFFVSLLIIGGCGPKQARISFVADECTPQNFRIQANDGKLSLTWDTNCPDNKLISGYNIYLEEKPIGDEYLTTKPPKSVRPFNSAPYPGDTNPDNSFETMDIINLDNGVDYYLSVRTVFPDNSLSYSSNQVQIMCRPEGNFELAFRYAELNDGFSFATSETVRADSELNDLYFYSKDGFDFIASPHRLNGFLRNSQMYSLGKTDNIYQHNKIELNYEAVEKIPIKVGESYVIKTHDNRYAKIRIEQATGELKARKLKISYIYQTRENTTRF